MLPISFCNPFFLLAACFFNPPVGLVTRNLQPERFQNNHNKFEKNIHNKFEHFEVLSEPKFFRVRFIIHLKVLLAKFKLVNAGIGLFLHV
jgi:hypothetical protein